LLIKNDFLGGKLLGILDSSNPKLRIFPQIEKYSQLPISNIGIFSASRAKSHRSLRKHLPDQHGVSLRSGGTFAHFPDCAGGYSRQAWRRWQCNRWHPPRGVATVICG
jgi:hypothetical protein